MFLRTVSADEYRSLFPEPLTRYGSVEFNALNASRAESVRHVVAFDNSLHSKLGLIVGRRDGMWHCPFSAPFGEIAYRRDLTVETIDEFVGELGAYFAASGGLALTMPPAFYYDDTLTALNACLANSASRQRYDFNYHYALPFALSDESYMAMLPSTGRRNLRRALKAGFEFVADAPAADAYALIAAHHQTKGYPVRMTLQQVVDTAAVIPTDCFLLRLDGKDVAAAIIQHVADDIVQLIYWGDLDGSQNLRPMNMMAYCLCRHYADAGIATFDLGPASSDGVPDIGLCRFKTSLGCKLSLKPTFLL